MDWEQDDQQTENESLPTEPENLFDVDPLPRPWYTVLLLRILAVVVVLSMLLLAVGETVFRPVLNWRLFWESHTITRNQPSIQHWRQGVVHVRADTHGAALRTGTGFNVSDSGLIITNRHIVEGAHSIEISFPGLGMYQAQNWSVHSYYDLAILQLEQSGLPYLVLDSYRPDAGAPVTVIGNPMGFSRVVVQGSVHSYWAQPDPFGRSFLVMELAAPLWSGNSGSPVFDQEGAVVGVVFGIRRQEESVHTGMALLSQQVLESLAELGRPKEVAQ